MSLLKTLLVDDEPLAIKNLTAILKNHPEMEIVGAYTNPVEGLQEILRLKPDLLFLDIQMPELSGVKLAQKLVNMKPFPMIVFVTAYDEYALDAFKVHAINYVLKPVDPMQIGNVLQQILIRQAENQALFQERVVKLLGDMAAADCYATRFLIKEGEKSYIVHADEIAWVSGARNYVELHTSQKTHLMRKTLEVLAAELDPAKFIRIHRSIIVNIEELDHLATSFSGQMLAILKDNSKHKISQTYQKDLVDRFSK